MTETLIRKLASAIEALRSQAPISLDKYTGCDRHIVWCIANFANISLCEHGNSPEIFTEWTLGDKGEFLNDVVRTDAKRIGLVDVDGNQGKKWGRKFPNLALMKISAWHKAQGDIVEWARTDVMYDTIYMSKVFTNTSDDENEYKCRELKKGGTGYDIHSQLPEEIDRTQPDYTLYDDLIDEHTAYGFLTRGCPNKCVWCIVPKKEGVIRPYMDIEEIVGKSGRTHVVLMDNNIIASGEYGKQQLRKIADMKLRIDFNQGLDARLIDDEWAELLARCKWISRIRFGCDTPKQIIECDRACSLIDKHGYRGSYFFYTMLGKKGQDKLTEEEEKALFRENYERVNYWKQKGKRYFCQAQPFLDFDMPRGTQVIPRWQKDISIWTNNKRYWAMSEFRDFCPRKDFCYQSYLDWAYGDAPYPAANMKILTTQK